MLKRLGIVVPYRDRAEHLKAFLPHLYLYFCRDKVDRNIPVRILIVEQPPGAPFNRGLINNIGFSVLRSEIDYVCFHDVDYLPIWADYGWADAPTMIIRHGFEFRPIDPDDPSRCVWRLDLSQLLSAVVLMPAAQFERANGFSNSYWGWGYEDLDLKNRLSSFGIASGHRDGTFKPLLHPDRGRNRDASPSDEHLRNEALFKSRWSSPSAEW